MTEYVLVYYPGDRDWEKDYRGFASIEQADRYLGDNFLCSSCLKMLHDGGYESEYMGTFSWVEIPDAQSTACGAEWGICTLEEYMRDFDGLLLKRFDEREGNDEDVPAGDTVVGPGGTDAGSDSDAEE